MRPIHQAELDKPRPVLVLTHGAVRAHRSLVTVTPITSRVRGLATEVWVGPANGLDHESVVNLDVIDTIPSADLGPRVGWFFTEQEAALTEAIHAAFDLV
jgi:mRNA interferase MazF